MSIHYWACDPKALHGKARNVLRKLSFRERGKMVDYFNNATHVACASDNERVIGWAMYTTYDQIMVYVRVSHRRLGIGRKLVSLLHAEVGKPEFPTVYLRDPPSRGFWLALEEKYSLHKRW